MIKAVIFDMFDTLITHYNCPLYFGADIAKDAGIPVKRFLEFWRPTEYERTIGILKTEEVIEHILRECDCYSEERFQAIVKKRIEIKKECFSHLHLEILPMLKGLKERGIKIGLISNCFSEEAEVIRNSVLFPYFDKVYLSCEEGIQKPDEEIFLRCIRGFNIKAEECIYIGDGGSQELETAKKVGMYPFQAAWYLREEIEQMEKRKKNFIQIETPLEVFNYLK